MILTNEQKQLILNARNKVCILQKQCDEIYSNLIKDLKFEKFQRQLDQFSDFTGLGKPASILFHIIFNDFEFDASELDNLQKALEEVSHYE